MSNDLKERLPFYTKLSFLISLIGCILACLLIPQTQPKAYKPRVTATQRLIELPPQLQQLKEPPPPPKPKMPVAAESEEEVEASTIETTDFTGFEKQPPKLEAGKIYDYLAVEIPPIQLQEYYVEPEYPDLACRAEIEGTVFLEFVVDTTGRVVPGSMKVIISLHELCDQSAMKAARQWRYSPAKQRDRPVSVRVKQGVTFMLKE